MSDQLGLFEGIKRKEEGIAAVSANADTFVQTMRRAAVGFSNRSGSVSADDLRGYAMVCDLRPHHQNAWGAIFKGPGWKCIGRKRSECASNRAREIRVWRWVG